MPLTHDQAVQRTRDFLHSGMAPARIRLELQLGGVPDEQIDGVIAEARGARASVASAAALKQLLIGVVLLGIGLASWFSHRGITFGGRGHDRLGAWAVDLGLIVTGVVFTSRGILDLLGSRHT